MPNNVYECMFIIDPNRYVRDPNGVPTRIEEMVDKSGGEILASRLWNEQKLAYPIKGHRKGVYWLTYFRMKGDRLVQFNRTCRLNDMVLRSLVVRVEPRLVDALVSHARGESTPAARDGDGEAAPHTAGVGGRGRGRRDVSKEEEETESDA